MKVTSRFEAQMGPALESGIVPSLTNIKSPGDRKQLVPRGLFGVRASMNSLGSGVTLKQFYWYYRVEDISQKEPDFR